MLALQKPPKKKYCNIGAALVITRVRAIYTLQRKK